MNKYLNKTDTDFPKDLLFFSLLLQRFRDANDIKYRERLNQNYFLDNKTGIWYNEEQ